MKKILVLNSGSSSIKYKLFDVDGFRVLESGVVKEVTSFEEAFDKILDHIDINEIDAFGHRVVHGGEQFKAPTLISKKVIDEIRDLIPLAPLHNPSNLEGITHIDALNHSAKQVAVFDTAFHATIPQERYLYPIPLKYYEQYKIRKYGFHGTSYSYILHEIAEFLRQDISQTNIIALHLGNGASACAIEEGKSVDTSMGFSPLDGLMMGTRSGSIDPTIIHFLEHHNINNDTIFHELNHNSGFMAIASHSNLIEIIEDYHKGDESAKLAIAMFVDRVKKYIGSYKEILGKIDALVFTGGIGENSAFIRELIAPDIDKVRNQGELNTILDITGERSKYKILAVRTDEEREIAKQTYRLIKGVI